MKIFDNSDSEEPPKLVYETSVTPKEFEGWKQWSYPHDIGEYEIRLNDGNGGGCIAEGCILEILSDNHEPDIISVYMHAHRIRIF